jgi:hypothetical protein
MGYTPKPPNAIRPTPPPAPPAKRYDVVIPAGGDRKARRQCSYCRRFSEGATCDGCGAAIDWTVK